MHWAAFSPDINRKGGEDMMRHGHGHGEGQHSGCRCGGPEGRRRLTVDEELEMLESRQRDLEQELADVVERVRRLRRAGEEASAS